jgi:DNA-binding NtrC family response regulator
MAAIPVDLAAASLFGARRGAFTGADAHRPGYFQQARGGTLFLDEVGDTPPAVQPLLLRALQEREVQVVGGQSERVDLRVISAMERDPDEADFAFRGALRHRLGRQEIRLPTLAQRAEDIGLLAAAFFERGARGTGLWPPPPPEEPRWLRLFELLLLYSWPGNVRELEHAVSQILAASGAGRLEVPGTLLERLRAGGEEARRAGGDAERGHTAAPPSSRSRCDIAEGAAGVEPAQGPGVALADLDDEALYRAWCAADCEVATLARHYGVSRPSVYRRIKSSRRCRLAADVPLQELLSALEACRGDLVGTAQRLAVSRRGLEARLRAGGVPAMPQGAPSADGD